MSSALIKAGQFAGAGKGLYTLDLRDISEKAEAIVSRARAEADRLVADAHRQIETMREQVRAEAHQAGYEAGLAGGRKAGHEAALEAARARFAEEQNDLTGLLSKLVGSLRDRREQLYAEARRDVIVLAIAIASRALSRLEASDAAMGQAAAEAMQAALEIIGQAGEPTIRVHPEDWAIVERLAHDVAQGIKEGRHVRVTEDPSVGRGGVTVETDDSAIDATIQTQLNTIADALANDWRERIEALHLE